MADLQKFGVVLTGGGSGGHIYPLFGVMEALDKKVKALGGQCEFIYIGPKDGYAPLFKIRDVEIRQIAAGKVRRYFSVENILDIPKFFIGLVQAFWQMYLVMPDVVFSKGGTGALPVVLAAWFYRIPVAIHESDAQPGITNLASARFAKKIFVSFARATQFFNSSRTTVTGAPIRQEILLLKPSKEEAKEILGFKREEPLTLILGGSQGSVRINEFIVANLAEIVAVTQVLHQTGVTNFDNVRSLANAALAGQSPTFLARYKPVNYFAGMGPREADNIQTAFAAADIVVMRPGGTIFEIAAFGIPAILIPITESANDHQRKNAYEFSAAGGGAVIEENNLLPGIFLSQLKTMLTNSDLRAKMSAASAKFFIPGAAEAIADGILAMAAGK
ncbi:MAG TPA: UDP-N-acetylglucosamine--N-acetylmuramyl-(pentapeptide) pyrophosphoryl-undecaprenol N-acetylglucosamine transferase [Candidatus Paceibacterota bacterium]|nr:UDP-N-acetylglucosamine--N-acetylmuramyl-(pentapeptide) pyrophosphoryl-undecaprenol N-acetylglucosamine transferase [Candidatus Paceibacterota bacterium]